jgi:hypothetical protein
LSYYTFTGFGICFFFFSKKRRYVKHQINTQNKTKSAHTLSKHHTNTHQHTSAHINTSPHTSAYINTYLYTHQHTLTHISLYTHQHTFILPQHIFSTHHAVPCF